MFWTNSRWAYRTNINPNVDIGAGPVFYRLAKRNGMLCAGFGGLMVLIHVILKGRCFGEAASNLLDHALMLLL